MGCHSLTSLSQQPPSPGVGAGAAGGLTGCCGLSVVIVCREGEGEGGAGAGGGVVVHLATTEDRPMVVAEVVGVASP